MNLAVVIELLQRRTGLDPEALGRQAVRTTVLARMHLLEMADADSYSALLESDEDEFHRLIDEVVVPETWFLRGGDLFFYLAEHVRTVLAERKDPELFRALSVPCSTGEEPYSLALALAETGVPAKRCCIDAIDVSPSNIEQARRGIFPELSFRQMSPELRNRYFRPQGSAWEIDPLLRSSVSYSTGNLLDTELLLRERPYDLIFCRNLFIYLHPPARRQGLDTVLRLLAPAGLLCLGHADSLDPEDRRFERTGPVGYFLYRRAKKPIARSLPTRAPAAKKVERRPQPVRKPAVQTPIAKPEPINVLNLARQQADSGQMDEALSTCRSVEERSGPSADLYSLMGVILQARHEQTEAMQSFRKALYLDPNHPEALLHLMLLYRCRGDHDQADLLRQRLRRVGSAPGKENDR
jgi:chemotaxis protein methyltransferase WspC